MLNLTTNINNQSVKVSVSNKCSACGLCFGSNEAVFTETPEGKSSVRGAGIVSGEDIVALETLLKGCPVHAITIQVIAPKSKEELQERIQDSLRCYKLPVPPRSKFEFNTSNISFPIPYSLNERRYVYTSYEKAKRAGIEEFNRLMFSNRRTSLEKIFIAYKAEVVLPYYRYEKSSGNFYNQVEQELTSMLAEIVDEVKLNNPNASIPQSFSTIEFNFNPKKFDMFDYFKDGFEQGLASLALDDLSGDCYSLSSYDVYFEIDDFEEYVGKGMFGSDKYTTKYCFYGLSEAFKELSKDLMRACESVGSNVVENAYSYLESLWRHSEEEIKKMLNEKASFLEQLLV